MRVFLIRKKRNGKPIGNWQLAWHVPGLKKLETQTTGTANKEDAELIRREKQREFTLAPYGLHDPTIKYRNMRWEQLREKFLEHCRATKRVQTAEAYRFSFSPFERLVNPDFVHRIDHAMLVTFAAQRRGEVSAVTVNKDLRAIRAALRWGEGMNFVLRAPKFKGVFLREPVRQPVVIRDFDKIIAVLDAGTVKLTMRSAGWWKVFLSIAHRCGCRRGEILGLTWTDVFLNVPEIRIDPGTSKGNRERVIPLDAGLASLLRVWREANQEEKRVLPWPYATGKQLYVDLERIVAKAGVKFVPKHLRSTCGTELAEAGENLATIRDILGHSTIATTAKYYTNTSQAMRDAVARRSAKNGRNGA